MAPKAGACAQITVYVDPANVGEFLKAFDKIFAKLKAMPEFVFFAMFQAPEEPGKITWIEQW